MTWDLDTAKTYLGISGTAQDAVITQVMTETLESIETVLGRGLLAVTGELYDVLNSTHPAIILPRYPVAQINSIDGALAPFNTLSSNPIELEAQRGIVRSTYFIGRQKITVDYDGGYAVDALPAGLERAMWSAFLTLWGATNQTTGAPVLGAGGTVVAGSGEVSSVTLADFGTVKFDVSSQVLNESSSGVSAADWGWLAPWATTLSFYRSGSTGLGLGVA